MQSLAIFLLVGCVSPTWATVLYQYSNAECSGDPIAAKSVPNSVCLGNSMTECNYTYAYEAVYSGDACTGFMTPTNPRELNICVNSTKLVCVEDVFIIRPYYGVYVHDFIPGGNCTGRPSSQSWEKFDVCLPDINGQGSRKYVTDSTNTTLEQITYENSPDCTGSNSTEAAPVYGYSSFITASNTSYLGLIGMYNYLDHASCLDSPFSGTARFSGWGAECRSGSIWECIQDELVITTYANENCTGEKSTLNLEAGKCVAGTKAFCSGSFDVPINAYHVINSHSWPSRCRDVNMSESVDFSLTQVEFTVTNICMPSGVSESQMLTYHPSSRLMRIFQQQYTNTTNCTGAMKETSIDLFTSSFHSSVEMNPIQTSSSFSALVLNKLLLFLLSIMTASVTAYLLLV